MERFCPHIESDAAEMYAVGMRGCACMADWRFEADDGECTKLSVFSKFHAGFFSCLLFIYGCQILRTFYIMICQFRVKRGDNATGKNILRFSQRLLVTLVLNASLTTFTLVDYLSPSLMTDLQKIAESDFQIRASRLKKYTVVLVPFFLLALLSTVSCLLRLWSEVTIMFMSMKTGGQLGDFFLLVARTRRFIKMNRVAEWFAYTLLFFMHAWLKRWLKGTEYSRQRCIF